MQINLHPIAIVHNLRQQAIDDNWGNIVSKITLCDHLPDECFLNIGLFSHLEIIYYFNQLPVDNIRFARRPRGNKDWPEMGIFAQRNKDRPNSLGLCTVQLLEHNGRTLLVKNLDAINETPVLDIKPVFNEYQPQSKIIQPQWVSALMKNYW